MHLLLSTALAMACQPPAEPPPLTTVRTWGHLRAVAPVTWRGEDGERAARLGVERTTARHGESVLVYGLFEGGDTPWVGHDALGPLLVAPLYDDARPVDWEVNLNKVARTPDAAALYVLAVPATRDLRGIEVRTPQGAVLARSEWVVEGEDHPWMPLDPPPRGNEVAVAGVGEDHLEARLASRAAGAAVPRWDGTAPLLEAPSVEGEARVRPDIEPLPTARLQHDGRLRLRVDPEAPQVLILEADDPLAMTPAHGHLLFRFWVDGKPFVPSAAAEPVRSWSARAQRSKRIRLHLDIDPVHLGAAPDATLAVQVLYAPAGWIWLREGAPTGSAMLADDLGDPRPAITQMELLTRDP